MGKRENRNKWKIYMGLLEKERVLYFLIIFSCLGSLCLADDNRFFDSKVDYFSAPKQECPSCKAQDEMNQNVSNILSKTKMNVQLAQEGAAMAIDMFLDPSCQFTELAIKNLSAFNRNNPNVTVKIYVNGHIDGFLGIGQRLKHEHPGWSVINDLTGGNAKNLGVLKVPAYIFTLQGKIYRIYGTPDLEETWDKINVTAK